MDSAARGGYSGLERFFRFSENRTGRALPYAAAAAFALYFLIPLLHDTLGWI